MYNSIYKGLCRPNETVFITLTSLPDCKKDIWESFLELINEIKDMSVLKNISWFAIETDEGNGVIHLLIQDCVLPRDWFRRRWDNIHGGFISKTVVKYNLATAGSLVISGFNAITEYLCCQGCIVNVDCSDKWLLGDSVNFNNIDVECERDFMLRDCICEKCERFLRCRRLYLGFKSAEGNMSLDKWM